MAEHPVTLDDLKPDAHNRRTHPARNVAMLTSALQQLGAARSIVIDEHNVILAGNGVTEAARAAGLTSVRVIESTGEELIAVRRSGLTDDQKRALAMYDNRTAELALWDITQLAADLHDGIALDPYFFPEELTALGAIVPEFDATPIDTQGRLDQKASVICPHCGGSFVP
jgi:ParB-like chromosome segregation protein Spo0J